MHNKLVAILYFPGYTFPISYMRMLIAILIQVEFLPVSVITTVLDTQ